MKHIRLRPGMYIGVLGNGTDPRHGIYTILKKVIDNSVDDFTMGSARTLLWMSNEKTASVRDYGQGIPMGVGKCEDSIALVLDEHLISKSDPHNTVFCGSLYT